MLPDPAVPLPSSLMALLACFQPLFTAPAFRTFCVLAAGFLARTGRRTVCGMLTGAGLSRLWPHHRARRFFSHARWDSHALGLAPARLVGGAAASAHPREPTPAESTSSGWPGKASLLNHESGETRATQKTAKLKGQAACCSNTSSNCQRVSLELSITHSPRELRSRGAAR